MLSIKYERPRQTAYQLSAFFNPVDKFGNPARYAFVEGTTKCGKTRGLMDWLHERALTGEYINYWWVAPSHGQAAIVYRRFKLALDPRYYSFNDSDKTVTLPNNHVMWFKSAEKPDLLFGEDVGDAVIDEGSRTREEAFHAVRSTLTHAVGRPAGHLRVIGNLRGRGNWMFKLCRKAEAGEPGWSYSKITAVDAVKAGILPQEEIDDAKRLLPPDVFNELYMAIPTEDGSNPFGMKHIENCVAPELSKRPAVCFGIDLGKSVDFTVIIGLDQMGEVCYFERFQMPWRETIEKIKSIVGRTPALIDSSGVGDPVVEEIQRSINQP